MVDGESSGMNQLGRAVLLRAEVYCVRSGKFVRYSLCND